MTSDINPSFPSGIEAIVAQAIAGPDRFEQYWISIGIRPMHRALIRRLAQQELQKSFGSTHRICWQTKQDGQDIPANLARTCRVEWIDVGLWINEFQRMKSESINVETRTSHLFAPLSSGSLRILWCWNTRNWRDFMTATPWMASGVVYNLASLNSWVRQSLHSGTWTAAVGANLQSVDLSTI